MEDQVDDLFKVLECRVTESYFTAIDVCSFEKFRNRISDSVHHDKNSLNGLAGVGYKFDPDQWPLLYDEESSDKVLPNSSGLAHDDFPNCTHFNVDSSDHLWNMSCECMNFC